MSATSKRDAGGKHRWPLLPGVEGRAVFSLDGDHRYVLRREWDVTGPIAVFVGLNPSTAEADVDDPTVRRCQRFASDWHHGSMVMLNIFAYRATSPDALREEGLDLVGDNEAYLAAIASEADLIIAAWGSSKHVDGYDDRTVDILLGGLTGIVHCLGTTQGGSPRHPLYVPAAQQPVEWQRRSE